MRGLLIAAAHASAQGHEIIVPQANAAEARAVAPRLTRAAGSLLEVCAHLSGSAALPLGPAVAGAAHGAAPSACALDLLDVRGQLQAKRALIIAAAGAHGLLYIGPPGAGKTMLAQRLPGLLPPLRQQEALEVAAIAAASAAGFGAVRFGERPFRAPHHTASVAALVGGGVRAQPGEISLAHHGVLFLDELPEFARAALEALREPLESGRITVARAALRVEYPAAFQLIAAMNPCPCGRLGDEAGVCRCTPPQVRRYRARVSGPLLDRLDMHLEVPRVLASDFAEVPDDMESSATAAARIARARCVQLERQGICNARLSDAEVRRWCQPDRAGTQLLETSMQRLGLSARARQRLLKLARTIADLEGADTTGSTAVAEAVMLRCLDRSLSEPSAACSRRPA